jgi:hypothetical protein
MNYNKDRTTLWMDKMYGPRGRVGKVNETNLKDYQKLL